MDHDFEFTFLADPSIQKYESAARTQSGSNPVYDTPQPSSSRKRKRSELASETPSQRPRRTTRQKLSLALQYILGANENSLNWTLSEFLWELFAVDDIKGSRIPREPSHETAVSRFLSGRSKYTMADVMREILKDPSGKVKRGSEEAKDMFSVTKEYHEVKPAYPSITVLAVEIVRKQLLKEIKTTVKGVSGLHGSTSSSRSGGRRQLSWKDINEKTPKTVQVIFEEHMPLGTYIISTLVTPEAIGPNIVAKRKMRPYKLTSAEILSDIAYCRTPYARLLPVTRGILYFACGAQHTLFQYSSRVGHTPSWNTTVATLKRLAKLDGEFIRTLGTAPNRAPMMRTDNIQQYLKRREMRMGKTNQMKIGMSAMVNEIEDFNPIAFDLDDKLKRIRESKRRELTTEKLLDMIDGDHSICVGVLQWLQVLVNYIPQLEKMKGEITKLYRTEGAKIPLPRKRKTAIYPLATVAKNENITTEFRDALLDFLSQIGQHDSHFNRRLVLVGGDGLTYERLLQIKSYLGSQDNELRRFDLIEPFLENWHTGWTQLSLTFESHWGEPLTKDPSKLGHSASKIGQKKPVNVKKVDYYPAAYMAYIVLDVRMVDCWRILFGVEDIFSYFDELAQNNALPTLDELKIHAEVLYRRYSTQRAYEYALNGHNPDAGVHSIPRGAAWVPSPTENSSSQSARAPAKKAKDKGRPLLQTDTYTGDMSLANSIMFIHDTMLSREFSQAVADGDPGRVYEAFKRMMFCFAGSSHTKYTAYTLETICNLELESSPELKDAILRNMLINPSGEPGRYVEGDLHIEHLNLELEEMIAHKDSAWDGTHIRDVVAPNISRFVTLKNTFREGVGLGKRRGKHPTPHSKPEVKILLQTYKEEDLHKFRKGRTYGSNEDGTSINTFGLGVCALSESKLHRFIAESTIRLAQTNTGDATAIGIEEFVEAAMEYGRNEAGEEDTMDAFETSQGSMSMINGELVVSSMMSDPVAEETVMAEDGKLTIEDEALELELEHSSSSSDGDYYG